ncbi:MAG TPA: hypothetical protein VH165_29575 [Kofleriaceae bacterium]|nr:hypothetical protein [Kofleriaceae bacterium]
MTEPDAPLAMNPFADIHIHPAPEAYPIDVARIETITVKCPVRGRGLVIRDLTRIADPALFAFFAQLVARGGELELDSDAPLVDALVGLGFLVIDADVVDWPAFAIPLGEGAAAGGDGPAGGGPAERGAAERGPAERGAAERGPAEQGPAEQGPAERVAAERMPDEDELDHRWIVAPTFVFQPAFALHHGVPWPADYAEQDGRLRCFAPGPAFWVGDPAALVEPRWVTAEAAPLLAALVPGTLPPPLPPALARALVHAGALVTAFAGAQDGVAPQLAALVPGARPPSLPAGAVRALVHAGALVRPEAYGADAGALVRPDAAATGAGGPAPTAALARFARHHAAFAADGYAIVRDLLPAAELAALRRYYAALLAAGLVQLGDRQNAARYSAYNDPIGRFVHARLAGAMSAVAGRPVVPSFAYFFSYLEGAALEPHKDRAQAEYSVSLQLDHTPEPAGGSAGDPPGETGWPLGFTFDDGHTAAADLRIGDAVLYHGRALTHHRTRLPAGQRSTILVLEYVPHDFRGLLI